MKKILTAFVCVLMSLTALAQSANMMALAQAELQKRGLNETEVRARLLEEGIDVDSIPTSEYASYQGRVMEILNKMQAEKAAASSSSSSSESSSAVSVGSEIVVENTETITAAELPQTTLGEAAAEQALEQQLEANDVSPTEGNDIYGHSMFTGQSLNVYRTTDGAQAPETYVLGEGDEVHISIFGSSQTEIHQRVAADGSIQPAGSSKIFLKGMNLSQARNAIKAKLAQHYSFRPDQIAITITTARTLSVSIYGEVGVQGGFTISALNTAFNALAAAGGPTSIGSVRNIMRSRAGKTERLDLYRYMKGDVKNVLYDLQNNDVLFVPIAQKVVSIQGAVRRPMRYEIIDSETLKDLIEYAGGLTDNAYPNFVQIERREAGELKYMEYDLSKVISGSQKVALVSGDIVRIKTSDRPMEKYVSIEGDVYYGGNYDFEKNSSLKALIEKAEPKYTARTDYVYVERTSPDETVEVLTVPFPGVNGNPDFKLQERDAVRILQQSTFTDTETIAVEGEVREPFTRRFGVNDSMTLSQAIDYAGGPKYTARTDYVFVERTRPDETVEVLTVPFPGEGVAEFPLQTRDVVRVLALSSYRDTESISVTGQVRNPFTRNFGLNDRMTISQAVEYAGGLTPTVYPVAYIFRKDVTNPEKKTYIPVSLDTAGDTLLEPGDELRIYDNTTYTNIGELRVSGAVKNAVNISFDSDVTLHDLITMAGGFEVGAAYNKIEVFRMNISKKNEVKFDTITVSVDDDFNTVSPKNFQLQPYDHVVVRMTPNFSTGRTVQINGRVRYPGVYVIEDNKTKLSDILKLAGGTLDDASPYCRLFRAFNGRGNIGVDLNEVKRVHIGGNNYDPILMDGDVISIDRLENTVIIRELGTRMAQYIPDEFSSTQKLMVYQGKRSAKWYVDQYAGGMIKTVDKQSLTVTLPNGQSKGTRKFLGMNVYPVVEPGSTITMTIDQEKKQKIEKPKEDIDWGKIAANTMQTLTSLVSMILLIERLN